MRIDFRNDVGFARLLADRYDLVDLDSREILSNRPIVFADTATGTITELLRNADGDFYVDPENYPEVAARSTHGLRLAFFPKGDPWPVLPTSSAQ